MKKSKFKKLKLITLFLGIFLIFFSSFIFSTANIYASLGEIIDEPSEVKTYYNGTIEDDFHDDKVIVVLNREATLKFLTYTPNDFPEIDCIGVKDLTNYTVEQVKKQMNNEDLEEEVLINPDRFKRILCLELREKSKENVLLAIKELEKREDILSAEPNVSLKMSVESNDPRLTNQSGLIKTSVPDAWYYCTGVSTVNVGIIDTGIDGNHVDLKNRISTDGLHRDFTTGEPNGIEVDNPTDENGHGTHVAGIIGAQGDNGRGISGVCWDVRLVSLKVLDSKGDGNFAWVIHAINYAASQNIPILNLSGGSNNNLTALKNAIDSYEGLLICAAGNNNKNIDNRAYYPSSYPLDNIISVGASDSDDKRSNWNGFHNLWGFLGLASLKSNYGKSTVDLFAPGTDILSTIPNNQYKTMSGSSMAAPFVSGVAALLLSYNSNLTNSQIKNAILNNVDKINDLEGLCVSDGRLNAYKAIKSISPRIDKYYRVDCHSQYNDQQTIATADYVMYHLKVECCDAYRIQVISDTPIIIQLYNSAMNIIDQIQIYMNSDQTYGYFIKLLEYDTYYLKIKCVNKADSGNIKVEIATTKPWYEIHLNSKKEVYSHLHNGYNIVKFVSKEDTQFINITLGVYGYTAIDYFPTGSIVITDFGGTIIEKVRFDNYENLAQNKESVNSMTVFLPYKGTYYIEVYYDESNVRYIEVELTTIDNFEVDSFDLPENASSQISNFDNISKGDEIQKMTLKQAGRFDITITGLEDAMFVILKDRNDGIGKISLEVILQDFINENYSSSIDLNEGVYYIGYLNGLKGQPINLSITREITKYGSQYLITDPGSGYVNGSEVTINGGIIGNNTITQGFTRNVYFNKKLNLASIGRLDYYWYSSNPDVATVSIYGTILAYPVSQNTTVKIMAVYKYDPSIVFIKEFIIRKETKTNSIIVSTDMDVLCEQLTYIDLSTARVPINILQYYNWSSDDETLVTIDVWGRILATPSSIGQTITIVGSYKFNPRVSIYIRLKVTSQI